MKIGMMVDAYKPYVSGVTNYIDLNKRALETDGHEVYVFTFGDLDYQDDEPRVLRSPGLPLADTGFYLSLRYRTIIKKLLQSMDIVHVHHPFLSGRLALRYCGNKDIPIVFTNHTRYDIYPHTYLPILSEELGQNLLRSYMPDFCESMDLVITPSAGMKKIMQDFDVTSHIEVIPHGIDLQRIKNTKPLSRSEFGFTDRDILLIYTGRIAPEKNLNFLLQSFAGIAKAFHNVYLLIVGGGLKTYEDELRETISSLGIEERVRMVGVVQYAQIPAYLSMCDIFVIASIAESFGLSALEAMSVGLPVMGVDTTGINDVVEDGKTGLLSTNGIAAYTAKLTHLCVNTAMRKEFGHAARKASEQYSIEQTTKIMLGHYNRLIQNTKPLKPKLDERLKLILEEFMK